MRGGTRWMQWGHLSGVVGLAVGNAEDLEV
jgi:hypothetical protein